MEVERPGVILLQRLDGLKAAQADARVDLDMGPHVRGAVDNRALDHAGAAGIDVFDGEIALHGGYRADGIADAAMVVAAAAEQAGLVEMDMGVDETGQHQLAADVDLGRLAGQFWRDCSDLSAGYPDIDRRCHSPHRGVAEDQVEGGSCVHGELELEERAT